LVLKYQAPRPPLVEKGSQGASRAVFRFIHVQIGPLSPKVTGSQALNPTLFTVTVYGNSFATKKFPTKILLKMIDSSVKNLREVESVILKSILVENFFVATGFPHTATVR
jgi:hypothetical protein